MNDSISYKETNRSLNTLDEITKIFVKIRKCFLDQ